jgi:hypothetical protein
MRQLSKLAVLRSAVLYIGVPILVFMAINQGVSINQNAAAIKSQNESRARNLDKLIADNAQQTQILCVLIIRNSQNFTDEERTDIQAICQKQIDEATAVKNSAESQASGTSPNNSQSSTPATSTNTNPTASTSQPSTPQTTIPAKQDGVTIDLPLLPKIHIGSPL